MLASIVSKRVAAVTTARRCLSTEVPIKQVASVLKLNVGNEETAIKMDGHFAKMNTMMKVPPCDHHRHHHHHYYYYCSVHHHHLHHH